MPEFQTPRTLEISNKSSDQEVVFKVETEFQRAFDVQRRDRTRLYRNFGLYHGVDGLQWESALLKKLNDENRAAAQFNVTQAKVDTLAGALSQEKYDLDWKPIDGARNSLTESIKDTWYADKELCSFEDHIERVIIDGLIMEGCLKMHMSSTHNPLKNIAFKRCTPGYIIKDPYWISDDDDDLNRLWEVFHLPANKIRSIYDIENAKIDAEIETWKKLGGDYNDTFDRDPNTLVNMNYKGHMHRVIEFHWMEDINRTRLAGKKLGGNRWIPFPISEDQDLLKNFMMKYSVDPFSIRETPYRDRIHHVTTVCPSLSPHKVLTNGISEVQPKRLPYFFFSANRAFGQAKGMVDDIYDPQNTINKRESKLTDLVNTSSGGGKMVNSSLFQSREEREKFRANANDPAAVFFVDGDELTQNRGIHYINSNQYPSQIIDTIPRMYDHIDRISKVPPTLDALSESSNESGILFARKLQVAQVGLITTSRRVKNLRKKVASAYFEQWSLVYNGPERQFTTSDGKYNTTLNKRVFNEEEGKVYIQNRPDQVPRCMVVVTESPNSPNRKLRDRELYAEYFKFAVQNDKQYSNYFFRKLMRTMDLTEEEESELKEIELLQKLRDRKAIMAEIAQLDANEKQAVMISMQSLAAVQQMGQPQQQVPVQQIPEEEIDDGSYEEVQPEQLPSFNQPEPLSELAPVESVEDVQI